MLAILGNLNIFEIALVLIAAIMIFGRRLPQVAARAAGQVSRLRRQMETMWRETGIEREFREVQAEVRKAKSAVPRGLRGEDLARIASEQLEGQFDEEGGEEDGGQEPGQEADSGAGEAAAGPEPEEPAAEAERREPGTTS